MPKLLSAVDSIGPAFAWTKRQLFSPFRFARWARLAVLCLLTGEFAGGGGSSGGFHYQMPQSRRVSLGLNPDTFDWSSFRAYLPWIIAGVALLLGLILLWIYVASVYRFVLFDSVLHDRCELKGSWRRWEPHGRSYFYWCLALFFGVWVGLAVIAGGPAFFAWRAGWFQHAREHLPQLILCGIVLLLVLLGFVLASILAGVFAKDFCVPIMALENLSVTNAWRRFLPMLGREKLAYTGFILMKIVLVVGTAILFGILTLIALVIVAIPLVVAGVVIFFVAKAAGLGWNPATISIVVLAAGAIALGILYLVAFVSTPPMVFFQAYVLHFFSGRYPPLDAIMYPPPVEPPVPSASEVPPVFGAPPAPPGEPALGA